jgi:hypothetical protein
MRRGSCQYVVLHIGDYYGVDSGLCRFFECGWDKRILSVAEPAYQVYLARITNTH